MHTGFRQSSLLLLSNQRPRRIVLGTWLAACSLLSLSSSFSAPDPPSGIPDAIVDLATSQGVSQVGGAWRYADAQVVDVDFRAAGPDRKPSGAPNRTYDIAPHAGGVEFDDRAWQVLDPPNFESRRGNGRVSFAWLRLNLRIPEKVGDFVTAGSTAVFEITVDDYAEVWLDGKLPRELGQSGGSMIAGFNVPNRLQVSARVKPGESHQLAVFAINGPISDPPANYIWVRSAKLLFYRTPRAIAPRAVPVDVVRLDPAVDSIVPRDATLEKIAEGFAFTEGPVWAKDGSLLFSDPNENRIYRWTPNAPLTVFRDKSGYDGADIAEYGQPGSNGLTFDKQGRLTIDEHGRRRVTRLEPDGRLTVLADRFEGKRLNSPNDLVYRSDGALYFTDPPFGLPKFHDDPRRELPDFDLFLLKDGVLQKVVSDLRGPNGLAFSPDEKYLYVTNWDDTKKWVTRYPVDADGTLGKGSVFFDMAAAPEAEALDGIKLDKQGHLFVSGPGGVWVISAEGKHLGTIRGPEAPANFAWGDSDGRTLYMTARTGLYRMRLSVTGIRP
ncbi:MAG: SMP-30/gluconolactonase/LRE family protein [Acidobacteriota bacterium]